MKRRVLLVLGGGLALSGAGCSAASGERSPSGVKVSAQQLQQAPCELWLGCAPAQNAPWPLGC